MKVLIQVIGDYHEEIKLKALVLFENNLLPILTAQFFKSQSATQLWDTLSKALSTRTATVVKATLQVYHALIRRETELGLTLEISTTDELMKALIYELTYVDIMVLLHVSLLRYDVFMLN